MGTGKSTVLVSSASEQKKNFGLEKPAEVQIPFAISVSGEEVPQSEFRVYIERAVESPNAPLPNPYIMDLHMDSGEEQFSFGKMQFLSEGEYHYRVRQEQRNHEGFTYDTTVYSVVIEVHSKNKDYNGNEVSPYLYAIVLAEKEGEEDKSGELLFKNSYYRDPSTPSPGPGPKGGNENPSAKEGTDQLVREKNKGTEDMQINAIDVLTSCATVGVVSWAAVVLWPMFLALRWAEQKRKQIRERGYASKK